MKLLELKLENFQGIPGLILDFDGNDASIYADNSGGKTTVFNAFTWLILGKPSTGAKNFTPKTTGKHYLNHSAEAKLELDTGRTLTLKKDFHEVYRKKRGSKTEEFEGHITDHYIDDVPVSEKEYAEAVKTHIGDELKLKALSIPGYFCEDLPWQTRREILLEICGDVDDEQVLAANAALKGLKEVLDGHSIDEHKKIAAQSMKKINDELKTIPARIDEAAKSVADQAEGNAEAIASRLADIQIAIEGKEEEMAALKTEAGALAKIKEQIAAVRLRQTEAKSEHIREENKKNEQVMAAVKELLAEKTEAAKKLSQVKARAFEIEKEIKFLKAQRETLLSQYTEVQAEEFTAETSCPTCGQDIPEADIKNAREHFNLHKSKKLEEINLQGKAYGKSIIADKEAEHMTLLESLVESEKALAALEERGEELNAKFVKARAFEDSEACKELEAEISALEQSRADAVKLFEESNKALSKEIADLKEGRTSLLAAKSRLELVEQQERRIEELTQREKDLAVQYEKLEAGIMLCELFIKTKVSMLTENINGKFTSVRFSLFAEQINGGIKEECEVLVPSEDGALVPYNFANNGGRINAGLEIISALSEHWGVKIPLFIDNAESVTRLFEMAPGHQVIRLVVSEGDKKMRLVYGQRDTEAGAA